MVAHWLIVVDRAEYDRQRMYAAEGVRLPGPGPADGDAALLAAQGVLFGEGTVRSGTVVYGRRLLDAPVAVDGAERPGVTALEPAAYAALAARLADGGAPAPVRDYLVSVTMPIEASSPAEAARVYWSYVAELGPAQLPVFVSPYGDELDMRAYVLGAEHEMDPEEDEDEE